MTEGEGRGFEIASCGCDCWYCDDCCPRKGYNLRAQLVPILETFDGLMMFTLTIDPELFSSPRAAYLYVRDKRGVSRLMRALDKAGHLHTRRYFYVVEFQQATHQAHFHVLADASFVPKEAIDAAWSRLRPGDAGPVAPNRPPFGMTRFSVRRFDGGPVHAARYATKYLVKAPVSGFPPWVLAMGDKTRVPRYQASRGFWNRERKPAASCGRTRQRNPRTYADRLATCGSVCNVFELVRSIDLRTGEVWSQRAWRARVSLTASELGELAPRRGQGRPRLKLVASGATVMVRALSAAVGRQVQVVSGLGASGARR